MLCSQTGLPMFGLNPSPQFKILITVPVLVPTQVDGERKEINVVPTLPTKILDSKIDSKCNSIFHCYGAVVKTL